MSLKRHKKRKKKLSEAELLRRQTQSHRAIFQRKKNKDEKDLEVLDELNKATRELKTPKRLK